MTKYVSAKPRTPDPAPTRATSVAGGNAKEVGRGARGKKKEGIWRAKAQRKVGKASPALEKRGLCPKRKKIRNS